MGKFDKSVGAGVAGVGRARQFGLVADNGDGRCRNHGARIVRDGAGDAAKGLLREGV